MTASMNAAGERTLTQWAELAEQAVRVLNHRTRPTLIELTGPAQTAEVIAVLASMAAMLPQLLDQLARWLLEQQHDGRLRVDFLAPHSDVCQAVHAAVGALAHASECSRRTGHALHAAHQHAAHLAADDGDDGANSESGWER